MAPAGVKDVLMKLDGVKDAAVAGLEADFDQEDVIGFVVLQSRTDATMDDDEVRTWELKGPTVPLPPLDRSLGSYLFECIRGHGNKVLQEDGMTGQRMTADEVLARSVSMATQMRAHGLRAGDVFCAAVDNGLDVAIIVLGGFFAGGVYAPFNPDLKGGDLEHMVNLMTPKLALVAPRAFEAVKASIPEGSIVVEAKQGSSQWEDFIRPASASEVAEFKTEQDIDLKSVAAIMCSSGTTGKPKGVMLSHKSLHYLVTILRLFDKTPPEARAKEVVIQIMLNFWMTGLMTTLLNLINGVPMIVYPKFDVDTILGAVEKHKGTALSLSPNQVAAIAKHPDVERYDVSSLRLMTCSGAVLNVSIRDIVQKRLNKRISLFYGQTECLMAVLPGPKSFEKPNSSGTVAVNGELKVINPETGLTVGPNVEGEICLKSPMIFNGYYKNPEATKEVIDDDGWVHTGDVGFLDEDGYLCVYDRYKELIKYRGVHIAPADVEDVLMRYEGVKDAAVVGIESEEDQEHPVGFVVQQPGCSLDTEELIRWANDQLPIYKQLHGGLHVIAEIPRTATGKIKRRDLRQLARSLREES